MKKMRVVSAVLLMCTIILASCDAQITESSSGSSSESSPSSLSGAAYNPKETYGEYGGTIDLKATADLSKIAFCVNDKDGCRVVVNNGSGDKTVYTSADSALVVYGTQWSPDGNYVAFCTGKTIEQKLMVYSLASDKVMDTGMKGVGSRLHFFTQYNIWSGDSTKVIGYSENGNGYYDILSGKVVYLPERAYPSSFSPDGKLLAWSSYESKDNKFTMQMYDVATGTSKEVFSTPDIHSNGSMFGPVWLSNTEFLISDFGQPFFHRVNLSTGTITDYLTGPTEIMISPDRKYLAYGQAGGYDTVIRNVATGAETMIKDGKMLGMPVWSYDSKQLLLCDVYSISVFGLDGVQIGETVKFATQFGNHEFSTPVYTKDGLWYEGKDLTE